MPETGPETDPLIFHWDKPVRRSRGLAFWLFVVLLALAGFFYLFQVVYPQAQRFTPVPHHIVALNASDPTGREVLNKVQDQDFLIMPPPAESAGAVNLEEHFPVFHPTFEGHTLQLEDLPHKTFTMPPARLLQMDAPVLPPLDLSELKAPGTVANKLENTAQLTMRFTGPLASRAVTHAPELGGIVLDDPGSCRFQVGVNADGVVEVALPLATSETAETVQKLVRAIRTARFAPAHGATAGPMWGTAVFESSDTAP